MVRMGKTNGIVMAVRWVITWGSKTVAYTRLTIMIPSDLLG